jgi:hypothetical protein
VGLVFLHTDDQNYYAVEINAGEKGDVRLIRLQDGSGEVLGDADNFEVKPRTWTTFRISINPENSIQVYSSNGSIQTVI